jgi:vacuolar-type H+-ATPase subunit H
MKSWLSILTLALATTISLSYARGPTTLREAKDAVGEAVDAARDSDRRCRDEVLDTLKDANRAVQELKEKRASPEIEKVLERALRRAKDACPKKIVRAIDDALDAVDGLSRGEGGGGGSKGYEPTMQDVQNATDECGKQDRYEGDTKVCVDAVVALMRGSLRPIALKVPASCGQTFSRDTFRWCMETAGKARRSPIEVNDYCAKNTRYTDERKKCIVEWSTKDAGGGGSSGGSTTKKSDSPKVKKKFGEACNNAADCEANLCLARDGASVGFCSARCNDEWDCTKLGGGFVHDWSCRTASTSMPVCTRAK